MSSSHFPDSLLRLLFGTLICTFSLGYCGPKAHAQIEPGAPPVPSDPPVPHPSTAPPGSIEVPTVAAQPLRPTRDLDKRWRIGAWASLNFTGNVSFGRVRYNTGTVATDSGELWYKDVPTATFGLEGLYGGPNAWGFNLGFSVDTQHKLRASDFESSFGTPAGVTFGDVNLNLYTFYVNAMYRWENFYIPFGLNYSIVDVNSAPPEIGDLDGGSGVQFGVGYFFGDRLASELLVRGIAVDGDTRIVNGTSINVREGTIGTLQLAVKAYY